MFKNGEKVSQSSGINNSDSNYTLEKEYLTSEDRTNYFYKVRDRYNEIHLNGHYDFEKCVDLLRNSYEDVSLTTDIIVGFPTETEEDIQGIRKIIETIKDGSSANPKRLRGLKINVSLSTFVPSPNCP